MNLHYYQGPYEYTSGAGEIRASDMVVPEPVYEEEEGNTPEELHIEEQIEEQIDEQIDEQAEEQIDGVERVPPYSRPPRKNRVTVIAAATPTAMLSDTSARWARLELTCAIARPIQKSLTETPTSSSR